MPEDRNEEMAREKLRGLGLWASLERHPRERRLVIIRNNPRMQTWGLYDRLLEACREEWFRDPLAAAEMAELALAVVETLKEARYGRERIADFRAGALATLGNARRLASAFGGAGRAFQEARKFLAVGSGDPLEKARLISFEASLLKDLGDFEGAKEMLEGSIRIYRDLNDTHLWGRTLLQQADAIGQAQPEQGVELAQAGLSLIQCQREPRLELSGRHTLSWFLADTGRPHEALSVLEAARPLYEQFNDPSTRLRLRWLEGRIARGLGDLAEAEEIFRRLTGELQDSVWAHELVLISLDLAEVVMTRGGYEEALRLVADLQPVLQGWGMHPEGRAVWLLMVDALRKGTAHADAFRRMADYVRRAWHRPLRRGTPVS